MRFNKIHIVILVIIQLFAFCKSKPDIGEINRIDTRGTGFKRTQPFKITEEYMKELYPDPISIVDSSVLNKIRKRINNLERIYFSSGSGIFVICEVYCNNGNIHKLIFGWDKINLDGKIYKYDEKLQKLIREEIIDPCHSSPQFRNLEHKDCTEDTIFRAKFFEKIKKLEIPHSETKISGNVSEFRNVMYFLIAVTGVKPIEFDMDNGVYSSPEAYMEDKIRWKVWYRKNKYKMNNLKADSLFSNYMIEHQERK